MSLKRITMNQWNSEHISKSKKSIEKYILVPNNDSMTHHTPTTRRYTILYHIIYNYVYANLIFCYKTSSIIKYKKNTIIMNYTFIHFNF